MDDKLELQAERYYSIFECFKRQAKAGILKDVVLWGITDRFSWRNNFPVPGRIDAPLLFDKKGNPKPAYYKFMDMKQKVISVIINTKFNNSLFMKEYIKFLSEYEKLLSEGLTQKRQSNIPDVQEDFNLKMAYSFGK